MFVGMGLSAVVPVIHGLKLYGIEQMRGRMGLSWVVLQGFLYVLGAGLYAVSLQQGSEAGNPSNLTILEYWTDVIIATVIGEGTRKVESRQFRYLGKLASDFPHIGGFGSLVASHGVDQSSRLLGQGAECRETPRTLSECSIYG